MKKTLSLFLVLSLISLVSGVALGGLYEATHELAENNILKFKKIPAVADISETVGGALSAEARLALEEQLLANKRFVDIGAKKPLLLFVVEKEGAPHAVTVEAFGQGFGGKLGVMAGFNLANEDLVGIGITTMSETPGLGTRVKEPQFLEQFAGLKKNAVIKVKKEGGVVDAVSGATISSRAVAGAIRNARAIFEQHREKITEVANRAPTPKDATP